MLLQYYSLLHNTTLYYNVLLRPKRRQNDVHPVLLRTTKFYSSTTSYYKELPRTTPVLLRTTKYYSSQYYKVLRCTTKYDSSTTPRKRTTPVLLRTTKYYSSTTKYYSVIQSTTPVLLRTRNVLLRTTKYYSSTTKYYSVLQSATPVLLRPKRRQNDVHPVLLRTTKYYSSTTKYCPVLQSTTPVLLRTTKYYSRTPYYKRTTKYYSVLQSTTPVLLRTTNVLQSTTPYYRVLLQYYSVLQSTTKAFQNEHFVRGFLNFSKNKLPKRAFRARLPQLFKRQASKTSISCEASATFQGTSFQNEHFVRGFLNFSRNKLPKRAFRARLPQLFKEQASKTSISCEASSTFQRTSFQNEYFVRDFRNFSSDKLPKRAFLCEASATFQGTSFQNEHFVRGFLNFSRNKLPKRAFRARLPQLFNQGASQSLAPATQNAKMTSHFESLKRQKRAFRARLPSNFTLSTRKSRILCEFFLIKPFLQSSKSNDFCEASATFQDNHQIPAPAAIFAVAPRLHVTAIAIRGNSTFATSQNAAPATTSRKATSQSAAPATKKRRACIASLPKYCACHAKHENDLPFCDLKPPKRAFRARLPPLFVL